MGVQACAYGWVGIRVCVDQVHLLTLTSSSQTRSMCSVGTEDAGVWELGLRIPRLALFATAYIRSCGVDGWGAADSVEAFASPYTALWLTTEGSGGDAMSPSTGLGVAALPFSSSPGICAGMSAAADSTSLFEPSSLSVSSLVS
jgi:hypothetical protein